MKLLKEMMLVMDLLLNKNICDSPQFLYATIDINYHAAAEFVSLYNQCLVAEQIHCGLTVKKYDLLEVQIFVEVWRLVEELSNVWLKFSVLLCELESPVCNMNVRI